MKIWGDTINVLRNPIEPGNRIIAGGDLFLCDTDMNGMWKIYRNNGDNNHIHWMIEEEGIDGQTALHAWFGQRFG